MSSKNRSLLNPVIIFWLVVLPAFQLSTAAAHADATPSVENRSTFIFYLENDTFAGTDRHYTNAVKLSWISKDLEKYSDERGLPGWARGIVEITPGLDR